ncbi:MAG: PH domain-containing protein [Candidatus Bathyarchaeota archaeon]|nr:MAG: PH domain-containing protein [Candidatus Bathyarchaeota archaeon]
MGKKVEEKIIKPPVKQITSGKIFKPSQAFLHKQLFQSVFALVMIWLMVVLSFVGFSFLLATDPVEYPSAAQLINTWIWPVALWTSVINLVWFVPALIAIPPYFRSIEYSVKAESGGTMPEIYSKRGIITITRKHVPFRTITNISSRAGPFDRLFKIGSVHIETAGYSGANQKGPEENLSGIVFYEEVRDYILKELRKFKEPYVTGTEVVYPTEEPVPKMEGLDDEILITLREIRDILRDRRKDSTS